MNVTAADLMATPATPLHFVVDRLVPHGLTVLAGAPKTGKSYLALQAAIAVAQGTPILGRSTEQGDVLYLALEDGAHRLQRRLHQLAPDDVDLDRVTFEFDAPMGPAAMLERLDAWHGTTARPRLVVVDTYGRTDPGPKPGQSEYSHITATLGVIQQWALQNGVALLGVHHLRKAGASESPSADVFERILGSQGMLAVADAALVLVRGRRERVAQLHLTSRDFEEGTLQLVIDGETQRWSTGSVREDPLAGLAERRRAVVEALAAGPMRLSEIAALLEASVSNASQHLERAIRDGVVTKVGHGVYALDEHFAERLRLDEGSHGGAVREVDEDTEVLDYADQHPDPLDLVPF